MCYAVYSSFCVKYKWKTLYFFKIHPYPKSWLVSAKNVRNFPKIFRDSKSMDPKKKNSNCGLLFTLVGVFFDWNYQILVLKSVTEGGTEGWIQLPGCIKEIFTNLNHEKYEEYLKYVDNIKIISFIMAHEQKGTHWGMEKWNHFWYDLFFTMKVSNRKWQNWKGLSIKMSKGRF